MASAVDEIRQGREENYLLPFFWQHGAEESVLREMMAKIQEADIQEVCVESRPHPDFCGPGWWRDMDIILEEAQKRNMRVWVLDDVNFPSGHAGGLIANKYPQHRRRVLDYVAIDALGPDEHASFLIDSLLRHPETERLEAVVAGRRVDSGAEWECARTDVTDLVDLTDCVKDGRVYWPVPEGLYSIIVVYSHLLTGGSALLNPISKEAVACQIEGCYEPHYEHYGHLFGGVFAGFFSDEPQFACGGWNSLPGKDIPLPWSDELREALRERLGEDYRRLLPALWLGGQSDRNAVSASVSGEALAGCVESASDSGQEGQIISYAYMDEASRLFSECFCQTISDWCHAHGVEYIGHHVEDNNSHSRLGPGAGHFFRAQKGQDMGGADIVMHQIHPGYAGISRHWHSAHSLTDGEFFHYGMIKLATSLAHIDPSKKGRALCENFGAYGWMEGIRLMKWLADHCLVRGINRFTPHAFTDSHFPEWDSPPHFYAQGNNPQYRFMEYLFRYMNRMCHLLDGGVHIASVLVLYQADAEWWGGAMLSQRPMRRLMQRQIDLDVVPCDAFRDGCHAQDGCIRFGQERYGALVIPGAEALPGYFLKRLDEIARAGVPIYFVEKKPSWTSNGEAVSEPIGEMVSLDELADRILESGLADVEVTPVCPNLRIYHYRKEEEHFFLLFNEEKRDSLDFRLKLPVNGPVFRFDVMNNHLFRQDSREGCVSLSLEAGEAVLLTTVCGSTFTYPEEQRPAGVYRADGANMTAGSVGSWETEAEEPFRDGRRQKLSLHWKVSLADVWTYPKAVLYKDGVELFDINGSDALPTFSGTVRYEADFETDFEEDEAAESVQAQIHLSEVYEIAEVWLNGKYAGFALGAPYRFDVTGLLRPGTNHLVIEVTNTLAKQVADYSSAIVPQEPGGLLADPELIYGENKETIMKTYLKDFMEKFEYPEEAKEVLSQAYDRIEADASCLEAFQKLLESYEKDIRLKMRPLLNQMTEIAAGAGVQEYTGHLLLCICMSRHLLECYREAGIDEQIWFTSMCDLKWKLMECWLVKGIWGTFVGEWFEGFFQLDRFGFLKLQFEPRVLDFRYEKAGVVLEPGTPMAIVHIPRTGGKLDRESMNRSFDLAADFFKERYHFDPVVFVCASWLLYPDNLEVLSPDSNLYAFITTFDLVKSWESENYYDAWRLFDKEYTGDVDQLPQDTSLRRAYADWIRRGKKFGGATGVYIYQKK